MKLWILLVIGSSFAGGSSFASEHYRLAFGGCNLQRFGQQYWKVIQSKNPDLWVWNGDIIYANNLSPEKRQKQYDLQKNNAYYKAFTSLIPAIGTWDDHDFASNNAGVEAPWKKESQTLLLDFLDVPLDSPRRTREGVYGSYLVGEAPYLIRVLLLDLRYFREKPGTEAVLLGTDQWLWLEQELSQPSMPTVIVSSSQALTSDMGGDSWSQYPTEKERLLSLLEVQTSPIVLISGDRHLGEISQVQLNNGAAVVDLTSSGLTHSHIGPIRPNEFRVGKVLRKKNFGTLDFRWNKETLSIEGRIFNIDGEEELFIQQAFNGMR